MRDQCPISVADGETAEDAADETGDGGDVVPVEDRTTIAGDPEGTPGPHPLTPAMSSPPNPINRIL